MNETNEQIPTPSFWPKAILIFFAGVILSIVLFAFWAVRQKNDLVRPDYYAEELRYQNQLDRVNRTKQSSSDARVSFDNGSRKIRISIPNALLQTKAVAHFYRPSDASLDKNFELDLNANGQQEIDANNLSPGFWKVRVSWTNDAEEFFTEDTLILPNP